MVTFFKKFLSHETANSVGAAALIVSVFGVISRLFGFVRDRILASTFGAGETLDAYLAAFRVPDMLFELLVLGAIGVAFIPIFTGLMAQKEKRRAWHCAFGVLTLLVITLALLSFVLFLLAPFIMHIIAPGFTRETSELSIMLTRIMLLSPVLLGISAVFGGVLISFQRFVLYSLAPLFYNVGIIIGILFFFPMMGPSGLAWGVALGAFLHMLVHIPAFHGRSGYFFPSIFTLYKNSDVKKVLYLMVPRMFATASNQLALLIVIFFASTREAGSITIFNFANNIQNVVIGLVGIPFALAVFPLLSAHFAKKKHVAFVDLFMTALQRILFYVIPLSALLFVLRAQTVRVIYGGGEFDWESTKLTFGVLAILTVSLFAQSLIPLLARTFYAMQNTKLPLYAALVSQGVNIGIVSVLINTKGLYALAWGFSVAAIINMSILFVFLHRRFAKSLDYKRIFSTLLRIVIATVCAVIMAQIVKQGFGFLISEIDTFIAIFAQLVVSGTSGAVAYVIAAHFLNIEEFCTLRDKIIVKIFGRPNVAAEEQNTLQ